MSNKTLESVQNRVTKWVLGTIKWHYDMQYIIEAGALNEEVRDENFETLPKDKQDYLIKTCSTAYKSFKRYLLINVCYLFGAYYEHCKRNNLEFREDKEFLTDQFNNFYKTIENFYKGNNKDANDGLWIPALDNIFYKNKLELNKKFFLALYPPIKQNEIDSIIVWFLENWKTNPKIKTIFDTSRNYFHLEVDENSPFKKINDKNDFIESANFAQEADKKQFQFSGLSSKIPLRLTYFILASSCLDEINQSYLYNNHNDGKWKIEELISDIIQNGPKLIFQTENYK